MYTFRQNQHTKNTFFESTLNNFLYYSVPSVRRRYPVFKNPLSLSSPVPVDRVSYFASRSRVP